MVGERVYDSRSVANYFIRKAGAAGLDPLQVMKLTYIAHGFALALLGRALMPDDIEAWQYGPVVRRVYSSIPGGNVRIAHPINGLQPADFDNDAIEVLDYVWNKFGGLTGTTLSNFTHREGSPWKKTWDTYGKNAVIPQDLIQRHYTGIIHAAKAAQMQGQSYTPAAL